MDSIPSGMTEVSQDEFWNRVMNCTHDVMPSVENPYISYWYINGTHRPWGWCSKGYKSEWDYAKNKPKIPVKYAIKTEYM